MRFPNSAFFLSENKDFWTSPKYSALSSQHNSGNGPKLHIIIYSMGLCPYLGNLLSTQVHVEFPLGLQLSHWLYIPHFPFLYLSPRALSLEVAICWQIFYNTKLSTCLYFWILQVPTFSTLNFSFSLLVYSLIYNLTHAACLVYHMVY